jgi:DNA-binding CsgD family transcriptional regulator/tetratricopeptide (TPR) repeat protein
VGTKRGAAFVGRADELATIDALLDEVCAGRSAGLVVAGEAGIGKSSLVDQLRLQAAERGAVVATGRTAVEGANLPYGTVVGLLRDLRRQLGPDAAARLEPVQRLLLGDTEEVQGRVARLVLFEEVLDAVDRLSADRPLVLVFEDLHWADAASVDLIDHLVRNLDEQPALIAATYRPDELDARPPLRRVLVELRRHAAVTVADLGGLSQDETALLVTDITGEDQSWAVVEAIHRRSEGNPLFAEELVAVRDRRELPPALRDLLAVRIDQLPPVARRVAAATAVLGGTAEHRVLAEVAQLPMPELDDAIADAMHHAVLGTDGGQGLVRFRHALLCESTIERMLPGERARLHSRAAGALVAQARAVGDQAGLVRAVVAEHRFQAGEWSAACELSIEAASACLALYSLHAAHAQLVRAVDAHDRAAGACRHDIDDAELFRMAAATASLVNDSDVAFSMAERANDALDANAPPRLRAELAVLLARTAYYADHPETAFAVVAEAEADLRGEDDDAALSEVVCMHGRLLMAVGRSAEGIAWCEEALVLARRSGARTVEGHALATLGPCLVDVGEVERALEAGWDALAVADEVCDPELLMRAHTNLTHIMYSAGQMTEVAEHAIALTEALGPLATLSFGAAGFNGTEALIILGRWDEAAAIGEQLMGKVSGSCISDSLNHVLLALRRGDLSTAEAELAHDVAAGVLSESQRDILAAELALAQGQPEDATAAADRALAALAGTSLGIDTLRAHAVSLRALADSAARPVRPGRRGGEDPAKAQRAAEATMAEIGALVEALTPDGREPTVWLRTLQVLCAAEASRVLGPDPSAWSSAAAAWSEIGDPFQRAYCRMRECEARLAERGERRAAGAALTDAWATAVGLGAATLVAQCEQLAERARITLDDGSGADASPRRRAASDLGLTAREAEVLELLADSRTDRQIADQLFISKKTASVHVSNILRKLDARDRWDAGEIGRSAGLGAS